MVDPLEQQVAAAATAVAELLKRSTQLLPPRIEELEGITADLEQLPERVGAFSDAMRVELVGLRQDIVGMADDFTRGQATLLELARSTGSAINSLSEYARRNSEELRAQLEGGLDEFSEELGAAVDTSITESAELVDDLVAVLVEELVPVIEAATEDRNDAVSERAGEIEGQTEDHAEFFSTALENAWGDFSASLAGNVTEVFASLGGIEAQARNLVDQVENLSRTISDGRALMDSAVQTTSQGAGGAIQVVTDTIDIFKQIA